MKNENILDEEIRAENFIVYKYYTLISIAFLFPVVLSNMLIFALVGMNSFPIMTISIGLSLVMCLAVFAIILILRKIYLREDTSL